MMGWLREAFDFLPDAEISIEVDPVVTTEAHLRKLASWVSTGSRWACRTRIPKVQKAVQRVQPAELTEKFYSLCRELGFPSVNMDLVYGLPYQTVDSFRETIDHIAAWRPDRIALFNYAHVPWIKPHQNKMPTEALPVPREKLAIFIESLAAFPRTRLHRHRSRSSGRARGRPRGRAQRGEAAAQLHGLHHAARDREPGLRRDRDQRDLRRLHPEPHPAVGIPADRARGRTPDGARSGHERRRSHPQRRDHGSHVQPGDPQTGDRRALRDRLRPVLRRCAGGPEGDGVPMAW